MIPEEMLCSICQNFDEEKEESECRFCDPEE